MTYQAPIPRGCSHHGWAALSRPYLEIDEDGHPVMAGLGPYLAISGDVLNGDEPWRLPVWKDGGWMHGLAAVSMKMEGGGGLPIGEPLLIDARNGRWAYRIIERTPDPLVCLLEATQG